jgi:AcrR family transcriptional regulator
MQYLLQFKVCVGTYLRDPESSSLGKQIVQQGIAMISDLGFEDFTFKKLALQIGTTEASVYRYFENKHRLLAYLSSWYWSYLEFACVQICAVQPNAKLQLQAIVPLLVHGNAQQVASMSFNMALLNKVVVAEGSKVYLIKNVSELNKEQMYKAYKDLCAYIAAIIKKAAPNYKYPHSLATTLIESAHQQQFFAEHLPRLTDDGKHQQVAFVEKFLTDLLHKTLAL